MTLLKERCFQQGGERFAKSKAMRKKSRCMQVWATDHVIFFEKCQISKYLNGQIILHNISNSSSGSNIGISSLLRYFNILRNKRVKISCQEAH